MALKWLGGNVDHPMADAKQARRIIAELPANDASKALEEITHWLETLNQTEGFKLDRRLENIELLDGAAQNHQRKLLRDYLSMQRQQKFHEHRLWTAVFGFWKQLGDAYALCFDGHESGASGAGAIGKSLAVIVTRALRAFTLQLKWMLLHYGPIEPRIWSELGRLYQSAESKGFAESVIEIYPGSHGAVSVKDQFLRAMVLAASATDGLPPLRQEIVERVVAHFASAFRLADRPDGCTHCFDLAMPKVPVRLFKGAEPTATLRYFSAGEGHARLCRLIGNIQANRVIPPDINLRGSYELDEVVAVLKHVAQYWSEKPPARGSERQKISGRITVVPGLNDVLQTLNPSKGDALDFSQAQPGESWIVDNVSDGGYGAIIPAVTSDWIKVGMLIGVHNETTKHWGIGLIRRITRDEQNRRRVGIQVLSKAAIPIKINRPGSISWTDASSESEGALLLSTAPDAQGEVGVVMREGIFNARDSLEMTVRDKSYVLTPVRMIEGGEDFDWASFKVASRGA